MDEILSRQQTSIIQKPVWLAVKYSLLMKWLSVAFFCGVVIPLVAQTGTLKPRTSATVAFRGIGSIQIKTESRPGDNPDVVFTPIGSSRPMLLLVPSGKDNDAFRRDPADPAQPFIRFAVLHESGLPDPLVLAITKQPLASDCAFVPALVAVGRGRLMQITPQLPPFLLRGGIWLAGAEGREPARLTVVAESYQTGDGHVGGPSKMAVFIYD